MLVTMTPPTPACKDNTTISIDARMLFTLGHYIRRSGPVFLILDELGQLLAHLEGNEVNLWQQLWFFLVELLKARVHLYCAGREPMVWVLGRQLIPSFRSPTEWFRATLDPLTREQLDTIIRGSEELKHHVVSQSYPYFLDVLAEATAGYTFPILIPSYILFVAGVPLVCQAVLSTLFWHKLSLNTKAEVKKAFEMALGKSSFFFYSQWLRLPTRGYETQA